MSSKPENVRRTGRLFHSIFLMGSGLAIGCGGVAKVDDAAGGTAGGSAVTGGGSDNAGGAGGVNGLGGATSTAGSGAVIGVSGAPSSAGTGGAGFVNPLPCSPAQWTCSSPVSCISYDGDLALGTDCKCDLSRPTRPADCAPGSTLICANATTDAAGNRLSTPLNYECSCVAASATAPDGCNGACDAAYGAARFGCEFEVDSSILCHCPVVIVLR